MAGTQTHAPLGARLLRVHFGAYHSPEEREKDHGKVLYGYVQDEDTPSNYRLLKFTPNKNTDWYREIKRCFRLDGNGEYYEFETLSKDVRLFEYQDEIWVLVNNKRDHKMFDEGDPYVEQNGDVYIYEYAQHEDWFRIDDLSDGTIGEITFTVFHNEYEATFFPLEIPNSDQWKPAITEAQMTIKGQSLLFAKPITDSPWEEQFLYTDQMPRSSKATEKKRKTTFTFMDYSNAEYKEGRVAEWTLFHDPVDIRHTVYFDKTPDDPDVVRRLLGNWPWLKQ